VVYLIKMLVMVTENCLLIVKIIGEIVTINKILTIIQYKQRM